MEMDDNDNKDRLHYLVNGGDSSVLKQLPPDFIRADDECPRVAHDDFSGHPIPLLSLDAPDAAHTVRSACQEWGIFHVLHHGIEPALLDRLRHLGPAFFAQSADRKLLYDMRAGSASASASAVKGGFVVSRQQAQKVLMNFYPRCPQPEHTLGLSSHTDPSTFTMLLPDEQVAGLQVTKDGGATWTTVRPVAGALAVNVGDHLHFLSNGRFRAAEHRVVVNSNRSRFSVAGFHYPAPDSVVYPLPGLVLPGGPCVLPEGPMTFTEMHRRKIAGHLQRARQKKLAAQSHPSSAAASAAAATGKASA